ncbi:MAG TPA: hypothetical protein VK846_13415, partial [Candidatus Limnocylindria bacterium]|nr:hypothetical protein [Candidatus Limnocylindria bacterium]
SLRRDTTLRGCGRAPPSLRHEASQQTTTSNQWQDSSFELSSVWGQVMVKMALELAIPPETINFENVHLTVEATAEVFGRLEKSGYAWTHDKWDTFAVHQRLFQRWAQNGGTAAR